MLKSLGFIIITYNRPLDTLELLKNISNLDKVSILLQEIIVRIDNTIVMVILLIFMSLIFCESKFINHNFSLVIN